MRLKRNVCFTINKFDPALVGYFRFSELAKRGEAGRQEIEAEKEALESDQSLPYRNLKKQSKMTDAEKEANIKTAQDAATTAETKVKGTLVSKSLIQW